MLHKHLVSAVRDSHCWLHHIIFILTGQGVTTTIQKATLPLLTSNECSNYWDISPRYQICAGGSAGNMQSACHVSLLVYHN